MYNKITAKIFSSPAELVIYQYVTVTRSIKGHSPAGKPPFVLWCFYNTRLNLDQTYTTRKLLLLHEWHSRLSGHGTKTRRKIFLFTAPIACKMLSNVGLNPQHLVQ